MEDARIPPLDSRQSPLRKGEGKWKAVSTFWRYRVMISTWYKINIMVVISKRDLVFLRYNWLKTSSWLNSWGFLQNQIAVGQKMWLPLYKIKFYILHPQCPPRPRLPEIQNRSAGKWSDFDFLPRQINTKFEKFSFLVLVAVTSYVICKISSLFSLMMLRDARDLPSSWL